MPVGVQKRVTCVSNGFLGHALDPTNEVFRLFRAIKVTALARSTAILDHLGAEPLENHEILSLLIPRHRPTANRTGRRLVFVWAEVDGDMREAALLARDLIFEDHRYILRCGCAVGSRREDTVNVEMASNSRFIAVPM